MANKKFWLGILVMVLVFGMTVVGCAQVPKYSFQDSIVVGPDESLITVQRTKGYMGAAVKMDIIVNDEIKYRISNGETFKFIISNGNHYIQIKGGGAFSASEKLLFTVDSSEIIFVIGYDGGGLGIRRMK